jgi:hypothetical protein
MPLTLQSTGERTNEPLVALSLFRRFQGKTFFGQHLWHLGSASAPQYAATDGRELHADAKTVGSETHLAQQPPLPVLCVGDAVVGLDCLPD